MIMYLQLIGAMQLIIIISDARYTSLTNVHVHVYHQYIQNYTQEYNVQKFHIPGPYIYHVYPAKIHL